MVLKHRKKITIVIVSLLFFLTLPIDWVILSLIISRFYYIRCEYVEINVKKEAVYYNNNYYYEHSELFHVFALENNNDIESIELVGYTSSIRYPIFTIFGINQEWRISNELGDGILFGYSNSWLQKRNENISYVYADIFTKEGFSIDELTINISKYEHLKDGYSENPILIDYSITFKDLLSIPIESITSDDFYPKTVGRCYGYIAKNIIMILYIARLENGKYCLEYQARDFYLMPDDFCSLMDAIILENSGES